MACFNREPRGLGFIEYFDECDAEDAVRQLDRMELGGREVSWLRRARLRRASKCGEGDAESLTGRWAASGLSRPDLT